MPIKINYDKCCWKDGKCTKCSKGKACATCVEVCPVGALTLGKKLVFDVSVCIDCGACISACKYKAISTR